MYWIRNEVEFPQISGPEDDGERGSREVVGIRRDLVLVVSRLKQANPGFAHKCWSLMTFMLGIL